MLKIRALTYLVSTMEARLMNLVHFYLLVPKRGETIARVFPERSFRVLCIIYTNTEEIAKKMYSTSQLSLYAKCSV
jgi:hypothetical protein